MGQHSEKAAMRQEIKVKLPQKSSAATLEGSRVACEFLVGLPEWESAWTVMLYLSLPGEIETAYALESAWEAGKTVLVPRVDWGSHEINAIPIALDSPTQYARYGLREPTEGRPFDPARIDLIAVPGLAFDGRGHRLGRGAGFYDRFLPRATRATRAGLAWELQFVEAVPTTASDAVLDALVTEESVRRFERSG